ncbi:MAG: glucose-1-phosphate adenylyltransferase [Gammaproteobacteria bacterium]
MKLQSRRFVSRLTGSTIALVLAGGRGSRLKMLTEWRAKPSVPFGGKFRIIDFALSNCLNSGINQISVLTQYKSHALIRHIQRGWDTFREDMGEFVEIIPAQQWVTEEAWFRGTADAVYQSLDIITSHQPKYVLVLAGDHVYQMDYGEMLATHVQQEADITIACFNVPLADASAFGVMTVDDSHRVREFHEKPARPVPRPDDPDTALVSMGVYIFSCDYLAKELQRDAGMADSSHDFGKDIIPSALAEGHRLIAYPFDQQVFESKAYWRDVGTLDAYFEANMEVLRPDPALDLYGMDWRIRTYQEQLPPAKFIATPTSRSDMGTSMVSGGCVINQSQLENSMLFSNVHVGKHCMLEDVLALPDCRIEDNVRLKRVLLDNGCHVPAGTVIGEDPEADAQRFHRTPGGVVVVNRVMLGQEHKYTPSGDIDHTLI